MKPKHKHISISGTVTAVSLNFQKRHSQAKMAPDTGPMDAESKSQRKDPMVPVRVLIDPVHLGAAAAFVRSGMPGVVHIRLDP